MTLGDLLREIAEQIYMGRDPRSDVELLSAALVELGDARDPEELVKLAVFRRMMEVVK